MTRNEIIEARKSSQIRDMGYMDRKDAIRRIIIRLYSLKAEDPRGHQDNIEKCAQELEMRCSKAFPSATIGEIQLAMEAGIRGEWNKDTRIYPANLMTWLSGYAQSPDRKDAVREQEAAEVALRERAAMYPDADEVQRRNAEFREHGPERAYQYYLKHGWDVASGGYGHALYEAMVGNGEIILPIPDDVMQEAMRSAAAKAARLSGVKTFLSMPDDKKYEEWNVQTEIVRITFERRMAAEEDLPC